MTARDASQPMLFPTTRPRKHAVHRAHRHSIESIAELDVKGRQLEVCKRLAAAGRPCTDRELMHACGRQDPNYVRPAITYLVDAGVLAEVDTVKDPRTKRTVRRVWFAPRRSDPS